MKTNVRIALLLTFLLSASHGLRLAGQTAASSGPKPLKTITVRIRNGKNGLPIWLASPYVFVGEIDPERFMDSYRRTRLWGDAHVDIAGADPRQVRVWIDFIDRDCRYPDRNQRYLTFDFAGNTLRESAVYDLDTILSKGIVATNFCGKKTQRPEPGVLTIYVLPESFRELWDN